MSYTSKTEIERSQIYALRQAGKGNNETAAMGRDLATMEIETPADPDHTPEHQ